MAPLAYETRTPNLERRGSAPSSRRTVEPVSTRMLGKSLLVGILAATLGAALSYSTWGLSFEEAWGLGVLFNLRGPMPFPDEVVVVGLDRKTQRALDLPVRYVDWPRHIHTGLLERLADARPSLIAYDIFFGKPGNAVEDAHLAAAIERAGNVLLVQHLVHQRNEIFSQERPLDPIPALAAAAFDAAPFPIATYPLRVGQVWCFKPEAGDLPTLPVVAFQLHALDAYPHLRGLLLEIAPHDFADLPPTRDALLDGENRLSDVVRRLHEGFRARPQIAERALGAIARRADLDAPTRHRLASLIGLYGGGHSRYLKFYGPPLSVPEVALSDVLTMTDPELERFRGKAVFVGVTDPFGWQEKDTYHVPYGDARSGRQTSGTEIAATAFANLVEGVQLVLLPPEAVVLVHLCWGMLVGTGATLLAARHSGRAIGAVALLALVYLYVVQQLFADHNLWLPWVIPVFVQALPVLFVALWLGHRAARTREKKATEVATRYLPDHVAQELLGGTVPVGPAGRVHQGVCLLADAERYTRLAEQLDPSSLNRLFNEYYGVAFEAIERHGGFVSDVEGDAALALWLCPDGDNTLGERERCCHAALEVLTAVSGFARARAPLDLPLRIGLHAGEVYIGDIGAGCHYEYRPIGDIVNTASRIENACKPLRTRLLASAEVLNDVPDLISRDLGDFRFRNKTRSTHLYELIGRCETTPLQRLALLADFDEAREALLSGAVREAKRGFEAILVKYPGDGPSRFFIELCERCSEAPPEPGIRTVIDLDTMRFVAPAIADHSEPSASGVGPG